MKHLVVFPVVPMGKPRMTQRDKWARRPAVMRYRAFKDELRSAMTNQPDLRLAIAQGAIDRVSWTAYLPIPASWPAKKKALLAGAPHRQKPDRDNIDKALLDALFADDSGIASGHLTKRWDDGRGPRIEVIFEANAPAQASGGLPDASCSISESETHPNQSE